MFEQLTLIEWPSNKAFDPNLVEGLQAFSLSTCQRSLLATLHPQHLDPVPGDARVYTSYQAYRHLLSIVCGLQSRLIGETEIVAQYRTALQQYSRQAWRHNVLLGTLERLIKDAKEIRTQHLQQIGQYSYAGLSKKLLLERTPHERVLILGSGAMAEDLCKVLNRRFKVLILARNEERTQELTKRYGINSAGEWAQWPELIGQYSAVINTIPNFPIAKEHELLWQWDQHWDAQAHLWIDLSPADSDAVKVPMPASIMTLGHLFDLGAELSREKEDKVQRAREALDQIVAKRYQLIQKDSLKLTITNGAGLSHATSLP